MNKLTYTEAMEHIRKFKRFYSIKQIAEDMNIAPSMLRNIVDRRPVKRGETHYIQRMPEKHKEKFIEIVHMLTSVRQIGEADSEMNELDKVFRGE